MAIPFMNVMLDGWWQLTKCNLQRVLRTPPNTDTLCQTRFYLSMADYTTSMTIPFDCFEGDFFFFQSHFLGTIYNRFDYKTKMSIPPCFCTDQQPQLPAINGAASHFTLCSNENSPFFNLKQKDPSPFPARMKPQHANGLCVQSESLAVCRHQRCSFNLTKIWNSCLLLMMQSLICNSKDEYHCRKLGQHTVILLELNIIFTLLTIFKHKRVGEKTSNYKQFEMYWKNRGHLFTYLNSDCEEWPLQDVVAHCSSTQPHFNFHATWKEEHLILVTHRLIWLLFFFDTFTYLFLFVCFFYLNICDCAQLFISLKCFVLYRIMDMLHHLSALFK